MILIGNENLRNEIKILKRALDIQIDENDELRARIANRDKYLRDLEHKAHILQEDNEEISYNNKTLWDAIDEKDKEIEEKNSKITDLLNNIELLRNNLSDKNKELIHIKEN